MTAAPREHELDLLRAIAGPAAAFRPGQAEAIEALVRSRSRVLVVQRTGWGKSAVYFIASRLLRERGAGATIIVSPLLVLMRNQIDMARRLDLRTETINSSNRDDWSAIEAAVAGDEVDVLLISPERLGNPRFQADVLPGLAARLGLLVIDEVHCISDWGHDFRPDYQRLGRLASLLPPGVPVLGTTATANDRVVADVQEQLGTDITLSRGTLERESLSLQVLALPQRADRLAWLAGNLPKLPGSGIVYCLTIRDAYTVAAWLRECGITSSAYTGEHSDEERLDIEGRLSRGEIKAVVATSALAMGYDNPHIEFVVHYQCPGSPVAYYQQVGRAGRAVDRSFGVLLAGTEDSDIQDYFIRTAFPGERDVAAALQALGEADGLGVAGLEKVVNLPRGKLSGLLKILEVEGAAYRHEARWYRSAERWTYPAERIADITAARRTEQEAMRRYLATTGCLMELLRAELDDPGAAPCGRCANCVGEPVVPIDIDPALLDAAQLRIGRSWITIEPRKMWPSGISGPRLKENGLSEGRALCAWGDTGWGDAVRAGKYGDGGYARPLVRALTDMLTAWGPSPAPQWVTHVPAYPGDRSDVAEAARLVADDLGLPLLSCVRQTRDTRTQKTMQNSYQQAQNVHGAYRVDGTLVGCGILFDDVVDSRWTLTEIGVLLRQAGAEAVYPVALADSSRGAT